MVLPALVGVIYLLLVVRRQDLTLRGGAALLGLGAFLGVTLAWFMPVVALGGLEYAQATLLHHTLERYVNAWEHTAPWHFYMEMGVWVSLLLVLAGTLLGSAAIAQRTRLVYAGIVGCTWLAMLMTVVWWSTPRSSITAIRSSRLLRGCRRIRLRTGPCSSVVLMNDLALRFNLGYFVPEVVQSTETLHYLERDGQAFCIVEAEEYQGLVALTGRYFPILERQKFGRSTLLLISNQ